MTRTRLRLNGTFGPVQWFDEFLTRPQCERILDELEVTVWRPSSVVHRARSGALVEGLSVTRSSETAHETWFSPALRRAIRRIERRIERLVPVESVRFESWQATRYRRGDRFREHYDAGYWHDDPAGDRERSIVIYLDSPLQGGSTRFPVLGLDLSARAGRLLTWSNLLPNGSHDPQVLHAGTPVLRGSKNVLVTWVRERAIVRNRRQVR